MQQGINSNVKTKFGFLCIVLFQFMSCNAAGVSSSEQVELSRWPDVLRYMAKEWQFDDSQLAIIDQIDSVYRLVEDSTVSEGVLKDQICRMKANIESAMSNDTSFPFFYLMQATVRNFSGLLLSDERLLHCSCAIDIMPLGFKWKTISDQDGDWMCYPMYARSWDALDEYALIIVRKTDDDSSLSTVIILNNNVDGEMEEIEIAVYDYDNNPIDVLYEYELSVDSSEMEMGIKRLTIPNWRLIDWLYNSYAMTITFKTSNGLYQINGFPNAGFEQQIKECPRILEIVRNVGKRE